jgi:hypothetical protein
VKLSAAQEIVAAAPALHTCVPVTTFVPVKQVN